MIRLAPVVTAPFCIAAAALASIAAASPAAAQTAVVDITPGSGLASGLHDINTRGQAVGSAALGIGDTGRAILWENGELVELGSLSGFPASDATAINERGQIVGSATDGVGSRAVLWDRGAIVDLTPPGWASCTAADINNRGDVVGTCARPGGRDQAVLWRDGVLTELGVLPGFDASAAAAINEAGVVVGSLRNTPEDRYAAFRWANGSMVALATPPAAASTRAFDINGAGTVVGMSTGPAGVSPQPVVWRGTSVAPLTGTWGSVIGEARGINERGDIVGTAYGGIGGYVWSDGIYKSLVSPHGSLPQAINDRGVAVGSIQTESGGPVHGAVWGKALTRIPPAKPRPVTSAPQPVFLGTLGGSSSYAIRINDRGQIIGYSTIAPGSEVSHPFLWENGLMRDLSTDPGNILSVEDINDRGQIVGRTAGGDDGSDDGSTHGAVWENGLTTRLPQLPGSNQCFATVINDVGLIAGFCVVYPDPVNIEAVGVFWRNGVVERIPAPAGVQLYPRDLNDAGSVIGYAFRGNDTFLFLWENGVTTDVNEATGGAFIEVVAINGRSHIAGWGPWDVPHTQALLWDRQTIRSVSDPETSSIAYALNEAGDMAGNSDRSAVLWRGGRTIELASPRGYSIAMAIAINDVGGTAGNVSVTSIPFVWQAVYWPPAAGGATRSPK